MEYYKVFIKVLLKEIEKFKLDTTIYSTYVTQLTSSLTENFDVPYYRCAYMYRFATVNAYFFNYCIKHFLLEYSNIKDIFSLWKSYSEVKVCSLSVGPGLDYLGFLLAILEYDSSPPNFNGVNIVSKHGAWRNTVNLTLEVFREQGTVFKVAWPNLKYENVDVIQADLLKSYSGESKLLAVSEANVILMMRTLNLAAGTTEEGPLLHMFMGLISSLKAEAIIFCIDTKSSLTVYIQALSHFQGKFLYGPVNQNVKIPVEFPEINKHHPSINNRGVFFVWQNLPTSSSLDLCANLSDGIETKEGNLTATCNFDKSNASTTNGKSMVEDQDPDNSLNLPWVEMKSFWESSSPKTKELLKRLMLTNEESMEQINSLIFQSEKNDIDEKRSLNNIQTSMLEDMESSDVQKNPLSSTQTGMLEAIKAIPTNYQNQMQDLTVDSLKTSVYSSSNLHEGSSSDSVGSLSPHDTRNSVSSFTCEKESSPSIIKESSTGTIPKSSKTLLSYHAAVKSNPTKINSGGDTITKVNSENTWSSENKVIQTDTHQNIPTASFSVKALTERIKQLAISLESVSQQNEPCNNGGDTNELHTEGLHKFTPYSNPCTADKPSCSKQSSSCGFKNQDSLPSYESEAIKNAPFQNMDCHYSCQCCHNRYMHCCSRSCNYQPCCAAQPVQRCNLSCNRQQSIENLTSPTIVIPLQHISDNALLQIISILKSESKN